MILTCPNCNGQFNVDDALIGDKGRKVKCSSCAEVWFQEPEHAETQEDEVEAAPVEEESDDSNVDLVEEDDDDDFKVDLVDFDEPDEPDEPEAVNEPEESVPEDTPPEDELSSESGGAKMSLEHIKRAVKSHAVNAREEGRSKPLGYGIAASVFFVIFAYLLCSSTSMMQVHPSMQAFYGLFGIHRDIPGKGLVFDQLAVEDNGETITVDGRIINLESTPVNVPIIEASLMGTAGTPITQWYIQPPTDILEGESDLSFHSVYYKSAPQDGHDDEASAPEHGTAHDANEHGENVHSEDALEVDTQHVQIRFALLAKTDEADDENSPAHHQDVPDHQSDHAESSKSHQPASSVSHQAPSHGNH
ncbi:MAG: hypothetical protein COB36_00860 [Alphaproteobacteria bacterium]|nr:MAG: hypothetical protein COB36_00860 [Alphaproteobacteria bacterium]